MVSEERRPSQITRLKRELTRLSIKSLTNTSVFELFEADLKLSRGAEDSNLRQSNFATSDFSTFLNVLKSSLGSGLLAMPSAFMNAGLLLGLVGTFFVGIICAHCTYILVKSSQALCFHTKKSHLNYPETTEAAFQFALKGRFKNHAALARQITNVCILLPHYGAGIIYVLMASATLKQILPIENAMKNPKHFLGFTGILNRAMVIVVCLSLTIGFFGYVKYGDAVEGSITLNLPDTCLAATVKILVALAILCTYGLQIMAAAQVVWTSMESHVSKKNEDFAYYTMRVLMVIGHVISAILVPQLAPVISLIGAIGLTMLGLALPAMLETLTFWEDGLGPARWRLWKNVFLGLTAVGTLCSGTWVSCKQIIEAYC